MKNKKFTYLLLVCVAGLWGLIFYRVFNSMADEELPISVSSPKKVAYFKLVNHEKDEVNLRLDYRDPFSAGHAEFMTDVSKTSLPPRIKAAELATYIVVKGKPLLTLQTEKP